MRDSRHSIRVTRALFSANKTRFSRIFVERNRVLEIFFCDGNFVSFPHSLTSHWIRLIHADHIRRATSRRIVNRRLPGESKRKTRVISPASEDREGNFLATDLALALGFSWDRDLPRITSDYGLSSARLSRLTGRETGVSSLLPRLGRI